MRGRNQRISGILVFNTRSIKYEHCNLSCVVIGCEKWVIFYRPCALLGLHLYFICLRCCSHCVTCVAWMNSLFPPSSYNNITNLIKSAWALSCSVTQSLQYAVNPSGPPRSIHCLRHICCDCTGMSGKKLFIDSLDQQLFVAGTGMGGCFHI